MGVGDKSSVTKEQNEKNKKILDGLLKLPENRCCADCGSRGPRWASVNLGVFLCIQCSGIHRSLGVHISQVRSATLDTWLPDQVAFISRMGNTKANEYWESELPATFRRPNENDRMAVESFIRTKYERKAFVPRSRSPPRERHRSHLDEPSRHDGGYSSDSGRYADDHPSRQGAATPPPRGAPQPHDGSSPRPGQAAPIRAVPVTTPPRSPLDPSRAVPSVPGSSPVPKPPLKVESSPALFDLLSLQDPVPVPSPAPASPPPVAPATTSQAASDSWATFDAPHAAATLITTPANPAVAAPPVAVSASSVPSPLGGPVSAPPGSGPGTMAALTDLFTASVKVAEPTSQPATAPAAQAVQPEVPRDALKKKDTKDILSLFDQGPSSMMMQQMMYMQQQQQQQMFMGGGQPGIPPGSGGGPLAAGGMMMGSAPSAGGQVDPHALSAPPQAAAPGGSAFHMPGGVPGFMGGMTMPMQMAGLYGQPMHGFTVPFGGMPTMGPPSPMPGGPMPMPFGQPAATMPVSPKASGGPSAQAPGAQYDFSALLQATK